MKLLEEIAQLDDEGIARVLSFTVARAAERRLLTIDGPIAAALDELEARRPTDPATPWCEPTMPPARASER